MKQSKLNMDLFYVLNNYIFDVMKEQVNESMNQEKHCDSFWRPWWGLSSNDYKEYCKRNYVVL